MNPTYIPRHAGDATYEARLYYGRDVREVLRALPEASVHMVCTSPPYWGLRDYGLDPVVWNETRQCAHEWSLSANHLAFQGGYCRRCGAWRGTLGLEPTPEEFIDHLVEVFRRVRRVLRPDGTLWVNLGDSYFSGKATKSGLKPKDLVGIPWRFALAMQQEGWYLRSDIVWAKPAPMPESVKSRPTRAHEFIFLFAHPDSKGRYFYDHEAIKEPAVSDHPSGNGYVREARLSLRNQDGSSRGAEKEWRDIGGTRNRRDVWTIGTKPYPGAHFAVWPEDLARLMIQAGTPEHGVCATCGTPWVREKVRLDVEAKPGVSIGGDPDRKDGGVRTKDRTGRGGNVLASRTAPGAWKQACSCQDTSRAPATVLDPFSGSATTGYVALTLGRHYIGIDLGEQYLPLARNRVLGMSPPNEDVPDDDDTVLRLFQ